MPDIDIDFQTDFDPQTILKNAIPASTVRKGELVKHPCGYYFQNIPIDSHTKLAAIPYKEAEELGFFKIDFLHLYTLDMVKSKAELRQMVNTDPDWSMLLDQSTVEQLFQIGKHYELVSKVQPQSVQELADCIALIRPNKKHLRTSYLQNRELVRPFLYRTLDDEDKSSFKRSHAIAYALTIIVEMQLIKQDRFSLPTSSPISELPPS